jgi:4-alpha-glucanotransferase
VDRVRALLVHVDLIRLDHFRGFAAEWHVPAGAPTAQSGQWVPGPGADFFGVVREALGGLPFLAEDLGFITPDVEALRDRFSLPGMRVLQFGFDGRSDNPHLPGNETPDTVVYTGTHDNPTTREWYEGLSETARRSLWRCAKRAGGTVADAAPSLLRLAWSSKAALAIAPLQDVLNLGREARMNVPGRGGSNWRWRCTDEMLSPSAFQWLRELTQASSRGKDEARS